MAFPLALLLALLLDIPLAESFALSLTDLLACRRACLLADLPVFELAVASGVSAEQKKAQWMGHRLAVVLRC